MSTTIAYSHKGGYWKTRYSFLASFMKSVGRKFFSSPAAAVAPENTMVWEHNDSSDDNRTSFYGSKVGSSISVSFNDNVSSNKIYKSFSLEGTNNINGLNTFVVNSDNSPDKQFSMGRLKDKGGIMYGHIGLSNTLIDGSNIKALGTFDFGEFSPQGLEINDLSFDLGGLIIPEAQHNIPRPVSSVKDKSKYFFTLTNEVNGVLIGTYSIDGNPIDLSSSSSWSDEAFGQPFNIKYHGGIYENGLLFSPVSPTAFDFDLSGLYEGLQTAESIKATLYEITPQEINGAPPRGQYAQADIALGSAPYELFSLNVNYEPTDLDHSK